MMIDSELEVRLSEIETISELFATYVDYRSDDMSPGCLIFLSEKLRKNIKKINKILRKQRRRVRILGQ